MFVTIIVYQEIYHIGMPHSTPGSVLYIYAGVLRVRNFRANVARPLSTVQLLSISADNE